MSGASEYETDYPRPQLARESWLSLDGEWSFSYDSTDKGVRERWHAIDGPEFHEKITVPFSPESSLSGIGDTGFHSILWYRREVEFSVTSSDRAILHFGAVDHSCTVWVDGKHVGVHVGGQSSFSIDVTDSLGDGDTHLIAVRAFDDPDNLEVPRGKQDWQERPHAIWYERTSGIWQTVWIEVVPAIHITDVYWSTDLIAGSVGCEVTIGSRTSKKLGVRVRTNLPDDASASGAVEAGRGRILLSPAALRSGQSRDALLWSPESPVLFDAWIDLVDSDGEVLDSVQSYFGIRSVGVAKDAFELNGVPYFVRAVLEQAYWPQSHLTAPDDDARRREIELIKELGFNTARIHQKVEDPRFLYWADRLGLMIWGESAAAYEFSPRAIELLTTEWTRIIARDRSHPSIVVWAPVNESWGVQDISRSAAQRQYAQSLASLTRALDPSRPVISNDGWEHVDSDIFTVHDYSSDPFLLSDRYGTSDSVRAIAGTPGPQGRQLSLSGQMTEALRRGEIPFMVSEFGGISYAGDTGTWGYAVVSSDAEFSKQLGGLFGALNRSFGIAGYCYTQFSDTAQEANGLVTSDRVPKLPIAQLREIITGVVEGEYAFVWPPVTS